MGGFVWLYGIAAGPGLQLADFRKALPGNVHVALTVARAGAIWARGVELLSNVALREVWLLRTPQRRRSIAREWLCLSGGYGCGEF
jgi:hypothetical protein